MSWAAGRPPVLSAEEVSRIVTEYFNFSSVRQDTLRQLPSYCDRNFYFQGERGEDEGQEFILKLSNPLSTSYGVVKGIIRVMKHLTSCGIVCPCPLPSETGGDLLQLSTTELKNSAGSEESDISKCQLSSAELKNSNSEELCRAELKKDSDSIVKCQLRDTNSKENTKQELSSVEAKDCGSEENTLKYPVYLLSFIPGQIFDHVDKKYLTPALLYEIGELLGKIDKELMVSPCHLLCK